MITQLVVGGAGVAEYARLRLALWPMPEEENLCEVAGQLADPTWVVFLLSDETGRGLGFLEIHLREYAEGALSTPVPYVEGWYVEEGVRASGLGRRLMEAAEAWARSAGFREIASDSLIDNDVSLRAHARLGFLEVERIACFLKRLD